MLPLSLTRRFVEAYNRRDADGLAELLHEDVEYVRPGPVVLRTKEAVRAQYEADWRLADESRVEVSRALELENRVAAEIVVHVRRGKQKLSLRGAVFHDWSNGRLQRYSAFFDPVAIQ